jgi:4-hydroxy-tetrahydrodipicolinate reductase
MIRLAVAGAAGRMGRCVLELASRDPRFEIAAAIDRDAEDNLPACDVLIDFTDADGTMVWLDVCRTQRIPMVIGATGHGEPQLSRIAQAAEVIPIAKAANFSIGMQAVLNAVGRIAKELGEEYDIEIVETHHRHKVDAPSGTALTIVERIVEGRTLRTRSASDGPGGDPLARARGSDSAASHAVFGRYGRVGERPKGQIGVHAVRMGEVVGQHEVHFSGPGETITIRHTAQSRETFATGALRAAAWVVGRPPGLYSMRDALAEE